MASASPSQLERLLGEVLSFTEAAKRLSADEQLNALFDAMIADATHGVVFNDDAANREACRQLVLAIGRVRANLEFAANWRAEREAEERRTKSFE